jgi:hypothetical protein
LIARVLSYQFDDINEMYLQLGNRLNLQALVLHNTQPQKEMQ